MFDFLAKKILVRCPVSITYESLVPGFALKWLQDADETLHQQALARADLFSADEWREIQLQKLKKILNHAADNVPFWREVFVKRGFNPRGFRKLDEFENLPIISRAELKKIDRRNLLAQNIPQNRRLEIATSGSTSEPFMFFEDKRGIFRGKMNIFSELLHADIPTKSNVLILGLGAIRRLHHYLLRVEPHDLESREWRLNKFYPLLNYVKPEVIFSTPSHLRRLAQLCRQDGFISYSFKGIQFCGEAMGPAERKELEDFFKCGVYSVYGSHECSMIGIECKYRNTHTVPWLNYTEIVDDAWKPVPAGKEGKIVVTFFENECMPFIRYALGDQGMLLEKECGCGRKTRLINFSGRISGHVELSDGSCFPISSISHYIALNHSNSVARFQLEQVSSKALIFRYVRAEKLDDVKISSMEGQIKNYLASSTKNLLQIIIERTPAILPNERGKTPLFMTSIKH